MTVDMTMADAVALDAADPLAGLRDEFLLPADVIYLDGNSLGAMPKSTPDRIATVVRHEWGERLIRSWNEAGWWSASRRVADLLAPLLGASADEVVVADSTSVNLFKLLMAGLAMRPGRPVVVAERNAFPTDVYIARSVTELTGGELRLIDDQTELASVVDERVGVVCLSHVDFRTGEMWPAVATTAAVRESGALMLWDLCHSTGAVDVRLHDWNADLAVGCGYKYLNGGPGAPSYAFVATEHHSDLTTPLPGWHGHADPFAMRPDYLPAAGIGQLAAGTPPMLSLLALEDAVRVLAGVSTAELRAKGIALTSLFINLITTRCPELALVSPPDADRRGAQVSLRFEHAFGLVQALIERGVIGDFRAPDIARFGFAPAYVRHADVWAAVEAITQVMAAREYLDDRFTSRSAVT
ncbi:MAG TPA: kynureninase [Pseudonocardiaceae bacterium]|nr:kynureninase [Pseudonocardiaceae bacterium]